MTERFRYNCTIFKMCVREENKMAYNPLSYSNISKSEENMIEHYLKKELTKMRTDMTERKIKSRKIYKTKEALKMLRQVDD